MIRAQDDPAAEAVAQVDDSSTAGEADYVWQRRPQCQDENLEEGNR